MESVLSSQRIIKRPNVPQQRSERLSQNERALCRVFVPEGNDIPLIECTKRGNVITHIDIRCSCGQVTRIVCEYAEDN